MEGGEGGGGDGGYRGGEEEEGGGEVLHQPPPPQKIRFLPPLPSFALIYISMPIVLRSRNSNALMLYMSSSDAIACYTRDVRHVLDCTPCPFSCFRTALPYKGETPGLYK